MIDFNLGKIGADVVLEKGQWDKGIASLSQDGQTAQDTFQGIEKNALAVTAALAAAGAAMVKIFKSSLNNFGEWEDTIDTFNELFGETAKQAQGWAKELSDMSRRSMPEVITMMTEYQTFALGMGASVEEAAKLSKGFADISLNIAALRDLEPGQVTAAIEGAMAGRTQGLKRMGVILDDTMLKEKALSLGYKDAKGEATELGRATALLSLTQERMGIAAGAAAGEADMFREKQRALRNALTETSIEIGKHIGNFLKPFLQAITDILNRVKELMQIYPAFGKMAAATVGIGTVGMTAMAGKSAMGLLGLRTGTAAASAGGTTGLIPAAMGYAKPLAAVAAAGYGINQAMQAFKLPEVQRMFKDLGEWIDEVGQSLAQFIKEAGLDALAEMFKNLGPAVQNFWDAIKSPVKAGQRAGEFWGNALTNESGQSVFRDDTGNFTLNPITIGTNIGKNLQSAQDAMAKEIGDQRVQDMWKRVGASVKEQAEARQAQTQAVTEGLTVPGVNVETARKLREQYNPAAALFADFEKSFKDIATLADEDVTAGFVEDIRGRWKELDGTMRSRFAEMIGEYQSAIDPALSVPLADVVSKIKAPEFSEVLSVSQELFGALAEGIEEARANAQANIANTFGEMQGAQAEYGQLKNKIADYEWAKYDRQTQVGEARETTGGGLVASALNRALGAVETPTSMSPQERELQSIRDAQFRSVELQGRLVMLQEQLNFLLSGGGGIMQMAKL